MLCPSLMKHRFSVAEPLLTVPCFGNTLETALRYCAFYKSAEGSVVWSKRRCQRMRTWFVPLKYFAPRLPRAACAGMLST